MSSSSRKMLQAAAGVGRGFYPYEVDYSCRFNDDDSAYLRRVFGTPTNNKKWTYSIWAKRTNIVSSMLLATYPSSGTFSGISLNGNPFRYVDVQSSASVADHDTNALFRDPSAWMHLMVACDTTNGTAADRIKYYCNGDRLTLDSTGNVDPSLNANTLTNSAVAHFIGAFPTLGGGSGSSNFGEYYLAQVAFIDGTALTPSSFGEDKNGVWVPKDISGLTFGNNGFWLKFDNASALGTDSSGNGNNWTVSGLTSSDQMNDTPTHNNVTWLPAYQFGGTHYKSSGTLSDGNLTASVNTSSQIGIASSVLPSTGKWYWEIEVDTVAEMGIGMTNTRYLDNIASNQTIHFRNGGSGNSVYIEGSIVTTYGTSWTTGDVIGVYFNADDGEISWYKNGTAMDSSPYSLSYTDGWIPYIAQLSGAGTCVGTLVTDENKFNHTPPTDALALSAANFPEPTIGPNSTTQSGENFNAVLWTGDQSARTITGYGFQPDFLWTKCRSTVESHRLHDAVRGGNGTVLYELNSNETSAEGTDTLVSGFATDGFTIAAGGNTPNVTGRTYIGWAWKGNGSGSSNTDGSITSTVSVNQDAGFSIVTYTGNLTAVGTSTIGHGLGVAPDFIIIKSRNTALNWSVMSSALTSWNYNIYLNLTNAEASGAGNGSRSDPTSTVFSVNYDSNQGVNGTNYVAYCFAEVEGFSSFGSYTGNGSTDGPFIYTGFRPAWVMIKWASGANDWSINDSARIGHNPDNYDLNANKSLAEVDNDRLDLLSNGFKVRVSASGANSSGGSYIYMAFAEMPFKYSVGR